MVRKMGKAFIQACTSLRGEILKHSRLPGLHVDLKSPGIGVPRDRVLTKPVLRRMLKERDHQNMDLANPFVVGFFDHVLGMERTDSNTKVNNKRWFLASIFLLPGKGMI